MELDLDLDSGHNDDDLESDTEIVYSPIQWIELALQRNFNSPKLFQKLENTSLYYTPHHQLSYSNFL